MLHEVGREARAAGAKLSHASVFLVGDYLGLPRMHDQAHYFRVAAAVATWPGCSYAEIVHRPEVGEEGDPALACRAYESMIAEAGGIDIAVLKITEEGRIGFCYSPCSFDAPTRVVDIPEHVVDRHARFFERHANAPHRAFAVGLGVLLTSRRLIAFASGHNSAAALTAAIRGSACAEVPASFVQRHPNAIVYLDRDSASALGSYPGIGSWASGRERAIWPGL